MQKIGVSKNKHYINVKYCLFYKKLDKDEIVCQSIMSGLET
jgi:hypothetical protein